MTPLSRSNKPYRPEKQKKNCSLNVFPCLLYITKMSIKICFSKLLFIFFFLVKNTSIVVIISHVVFTIFEKTLSSNVQRFYDKLRSINFTRQLFVSYFPEYLWVTHEIFARFFFPEIKLMQSFKHERIFLKSFSSWSFFSIIYFSGNFSKPRSWRNKWWKKSGWNFYLVQF